MHNKNPGYRPDIDGLRAIAVLAVVLFHINSSLAPGGFIGVDIFFVISGYLITGNIIKDKASQTGFSWAEFYRRRALRILPVLFVVILATLVVGHFILLPNDLKELSYVSIASTLPAANIYFTYFLDTSYFADASTLQPLLHLWSLGIEEQFYLFWPSILLLLLTRTRHLTSLAVVALLTAASFVLAESLLVSQPMFTYYMLPTRAGELLIGAFLALFLTQQNIADLSSRWNNLMGGGAALIIFSIGWITEDVGFPGFSALPSTLGAALIICSSSSKASVIGRLLAWPPLVFIGLISYSLYLWHWPVLAFYRYAQGPVESLAGAVLFALMILLSIISYRWVERPLRGLKWNFDQVIFKGLAPATALLFSVYAAVVLTKGYGFYIFDRDYQHALSLIKPSPAAYTYPYVCQSYQLDDRILNKADCIIGRTSDQEPAALLWGDSHAAHHVGVLGAFTEGGQFSFRNAAHSSCPPLLEGIETMLPPTRQKDCIDSVAIVRKYLGRYSTVIMGAAWEGYKKNPNYLIHLENTVDILLGEGKRIILLGQIPGFESVDRKCQQKALKALVRRCSNDETREPLSAMPAINKSLQALAARRDNVFYFDVSSVLCHDNVCRSTIDERPVYFDSNHLSMEGSWAVGQRLLQIEGVPDIFLTAVRP